MAQRQRADDNPIRLQLTWEGGSSDRLSVVMGWSGSPTAGGIKVSVYFVVEHFEAEAEAERGRNSLCCRYELCICSNLKPSHSWLSLC